MSYETTVGVIEKLLEEKQRLIDAGVKRNDPTTWRPDLVRPIAEYVRELKGAAT